jgi:hypothetical protein
LDHGPQSLTRAAPAHKSTDEILAHPRFEDARDALVDEFVDLFADSPFLTRLIADAGCLMLAAVLVGMHANHDENDRATWATHGRVQELVADRKLASLRRLDDLIGRFRQTGYIESIPTASDKRVRILRPTELLLSHDCAYLAVYHRFLHRLYPDRGYDWSTRLDSRVHLAVRKISFHAQPMAAAFVRHPIMMVFLARDAGFMLPLLAIQSARAGAPVDAASFTTIARRVGVSRTHVRNIFTDAAAAGFVSLDGEAGTVRLLPRFWPAYDRGVADMESACDAIAQRAFAVV